MKRKFIEKDNKKYVLNSEAFRKATEQLLEDRSLNSILRDMIEVENLTVSLETVKAWYYGNNGTDDIENVSKIASYLHIEEEKLLIQTDEIMILFSDANSVSKKQTLRASLYNISRWIQDTKMKKLIVAIVGISFALFMSHTKNQLLAIVSAVVFIECIKFLDYHYFEKDRNWWDNVCMVLWYAFKGFMWLIIFINLVVTCIG